jgi:methylated-DNA-[protein]-cysteine S-methyltransferase
VETYEYSTPFGRGYVEAEGDEVLRILLPGSREREALMPELARGEAGKVLSFLELYFKGEVRVHDLDVGMLLARSGYRGFSRRVLEEVSSIPCGETRTYGEIAKMAGSPRAWRAVGNILHRNPFPILVPCHRVVRVDGLGGFGSGPEMKRALLELEERFSQRVKDFSRSKFHIHR